MDNNNSSSEFIKVRDEVSLMMKVNIHDMLSKSREIKNVLARNVLIYIMRSHFNFSYVEIAKLIGLKHTTIINSYKKVNKLEFLADYADVLFRTKIAN